jgi:protein-disulfide isomerase
MPLVSLILSALVLSHITSAAILAAEYPDMEITLPEVTLITPDNSGHIEYLGLDSSPGTPFSLSEIDADILLIELFSMYCPYCQNAAPCQQALRVDGKA